MSKEHFMVNLLNSICLVRENLCLYLMSLIEPLQSRNRVLKTEQFSHSLQVTAINKYNIKNDIKINILNIYFTILTVSDREVY